jgi:hypothetical protein
MSLYLLEHPESDAKLANGFCSPALYPNEPQLSLHKTHPEHLRIIRLCFENYWYHFLPDLFGLLPLPTSVQNAAGKKWRCHRPNVVSQL